MAQRTVISKPSYRFRKRKHPIDRNPNSREKARARENTNNYQQSRRTRGDFKSPSIINDDTTNNNIKMQEPRKKKRRISNDEFGFKCQRYRSKNIYNQNNQQHQNKIYFNNGYDDIYCNDQSVRRERNECKYNPDRYLNLDFDIECAECVNKIYEYINRTWKEPEIRYHPVRGEERYKFESWMYQKQYNQLFCVPRHASFDSYEPIPLPDIIKSIFDKKRKQKRGMADISDINRINPRLCLLFKKYMTSPIPYNLRHTISKFQGMSIKQWKNYGMKHLLDMQDQELTKKNCVCIVHTDTKRAYLPDLIKNNDMEFNRLWQIFDENNSMIVKAQWINYYPNDPSEWLQATNGKDNPLLHLFRKLHCPSFDKFMTTWKHYAIEGRDELKQTRIINNFNRRHFRFNNIRF